MSQKKKVLIIKLGQHRDDKPYQKIESFSSKLLKVTVVKNNLKLSAALKENSDQTSGIYDINALADFIQKQDDLHVADYDLVLGCIDRPVNTDEILKEVCREVEPNKFNILCTSNIMELLNEGKVSLLNFLLNIIYGMYTRKFLDIDPEYHENPGCLLDYYFLDRDMIVGCVKPVLCEECMADVVNKQAAEVLNRELMKIRIPLYIRLIEYVKQKTVLSMIIAVVTSLFFGMISSYMASLALEGTFWEKIIITVSPLVIMCILITPFLKKDKRR